MNIEFDYNKSISEYFTFIESGYKVEYSNIEDKILEPQDNIVNQFNDSKLSSFNLESIHYEKILVSGDASQKDLEGKEDLS